LAKIGTRSTLPSPSFLELGRREVAQQQAGALEHVDVVEEPAGLQDTIIVALVIRRVNFLQSGCANEPLRGLPCEASPKAQMLISTATGRGNRLDAGATCRIPWSES
jgi:hypothetical protein